MIEQQLKQYINLKKDLEKYFYSDEARQLISEYLKKIRGWERVFTDRITMIDIDEEDIIIDYYIDYYCGCGGDDQELVPIKWFFSEEERNKIIEEKKERDLNEQILREEKLQKQKLAEEKAERNLYYLLKTKYGDVLNE
jgi:hypothetical protein